MTYTKAWLNYEKMDDSPERICVALSETGPIADSIRRELQIAFEAMYGVAPIFADQTDKEALFVTFHCSKVHMYGEEGYLVKAVPGKITVESGGQRGLLYGMFAMLERLRMGEYAFTLAQTPSNPIRMLDHWDNLDGSIERGYSGNSFFFCNEEVTVTERIRDYARMIASVGINAVCINNVNVRGVAAELITARYRAPLVQLSRIFEAYGVKLFLSLNFASPKRIGGLDTSDPCDERVRAFWRERIADVFEGIPNFGGFVVKADSEGEPGPFAYGRTHADGANMLAEFARPYGGIVIWRCFVYNCQQDWRDTKTDRARSGYDNFIGHDGEFADNVILQIKNGPMDFQVREPVHPLFGGLKKTNMMLEVQIAQEYTGQQRHVCYLLPMFHEILNFRTFCGQESDTIADIVSGRTYGNRNCGMVAVTNTGDDENWTGHDLAAANLYGFGRLAFNTSLSAEDIARDWIRLTFGLNQKVLENVQAILMMSWPAYEKYTSPLGIGWLVTPHTHYGPDVEGYEYDRWGTYHRADHMGIGVDRTPAGTGYTAQYNEPNASMYANVETCPEELLLFFHHMPYAHVLKTGKTIIQHIYDTHFEGAEEAERMLALWRELQGLVEPASYMRTLARFENQAEHAKEWRDRINTYFHRMSWVEDEKGRKIY